MILPSGQPLHEKLSTAFTQFNGMIADLKNNRFTGYVQLTTTEYAGVLFFDTGNVVGAMDEAKGTRRSGSVAAQAIASKGEEKNGAISVYHLPEEVIPLLASMGQGESIYHNLTSDLTSLEKLIAKLESDRHTGYIEVNINCGKGAGLVIFQSGHLTTCVLSIDREIVEGNRATSQMLEIISRLGASFNVYSSVVEKTLANTSEIDQGLELPQLLAVWEEIIKAIEKTVDGLSTKGQFITVLKRTLSEKAHEYPFLSPIGGEFQYKDGHVSFLGRPCENLSDGLGVCLSATVANLEAKLPKANLMVRTKVALGQVKQNHIEVFQKLALETKLDLLNMSLYERVIAESLPFLGSNTTAFIERQCREHLGITPPALKSERLGNLAQRLETSAALLIPREKAQALRQKIEALA